MLVENNLFIYFGFFLMQGFYDIDMNCCFMFKNNGSVKCVVKEFVQMYKDFKGKEQI